jgi:hypothetical protein
MLNQYKYIEETHRIAIEAAIRNHTGITPSLAARLYKHAMDAVTNCRTSGENGFFHSYMEVDNLGIGTCTDAKAGFYVQLARRKDDPHHLLLTLGQKWAMENVDVMRGNTNMLFW